MHYTTWTIDMCMEAWRTLWNYWKHVQRDQKWIAGNRLLYKPTSNRAYWSKSIRSMTSIPFMHWSSSQGCNKMMSHNETFNFHSVPSKTSNKKLHSQGKLIALLHIFAIIVLYILLNYCDSFTGLGPHGTWIQMIIYKATTYQWYILHTDLIKTNLKNCNQLALLY